MGSRPSSRVVPTFSFNSSTVTSLSVGSSGFVKLKTNPQLPKNFHERYTLSYKLGRGSFATVYSISDALKLFADNELVVKVVDVRDRVGELPHEQGGGSPSKRAGGSPSKNVGGSHSKRTDPRSGIHNRSCESTRKPISEFSNRLAVKNEIYIMKHISNVKHCVKFVDAFYDPEFCYILMERCDLTLHGMLRSRADLSEQSFVPIARGMFLGLAAIHDHGVIHCDIKPDNYIFNQRENVVKLCDFGLGRCVTATNPFVDGIRGTAPFISPEMLTGCPCGVPTDIWSVGVIIYAILLGEFPYMPDKPGSQAMKAMIKAGIPKPSFCIASTRGLHCGMQPSEVSISFLHDLIDRDPLTRATAKAALDKPWFQVSSTSGHCTHPLEPLIASAARVGAFKLPENDSLGDPLGDIDTLLMGRQEAFKTRRAHLAHVGKKPKICQTNIE